MSTSYDTEQAFMRYIDALPNSTGKRFIQIHVRKYGIEGFERFWEKMRDMFAGKDRSFSDEEAESMALALMPPGMGRRRFLKLGLSALMAGQAAYFAPTAIANFIQSFHDWRLEDHRFFNTFVAGSSLGAAFGGVMLWNMTEEGHRERLNDLVRGEDGQRNVTQLVNSLDAFFLRIEVAMAENGIMQEGKNQPRR